MYELDDCMDEQMNGILNAQLVQNIKPPIMLVKQVCMDQQSQPALVSGQCHSVVTVLVFLNRNVTGFSRE